jgi:hypothetical protein
MGTLRIATFLVLSFASIARGDEKLAGRACRSVHLGYPAAEGTAFYNEIKVERSAEGTYFMVCGWNKGYFGIQELGNGKKVVIFSVWESGNQNDPKSVPEEKRVKMLDKDEKTRVGRFGNEGTGGQSFYDLDWKIGETYRFMVTAKADGERTVYSGFFFHPDQKKWIKMVTFSTLGGGGTLKGYYSFVEDFRRNGESLKKAREARYGNGWVKTKDGKWVAIDKARFTGDSNPATNIDARFDGGTWVLGTGGDIENKHAKLRDVIERPAGAGAPEAPADIVGLQ